MKKKNIRTFLFCATAFASFFVIMLCAVGYATVFLRSAGVNKAVTGFFIGGVTMYYGGSTVMLIVSLAITVVGFILALAANLAARNHSVESSDNP